MQYKELDIRDMYIDDKDIYLAMGYKSHSPEGAIPELLERVKTEVYPLCVPRYMYHISEGELSDRRQITVGNVNFETGRIIASYLDRVSHFCLFVSTAGKEFNQYIHRIKQTGDIVKEFVADSLGTVIAEACVSQITKELERNSTLSHSLPYSPGYCGWNISEQSKLFSFFPPAPCDVTLSESFLMSPVKSVSGIIGLGKELKPQPYRCELCTNKNCYKRKNN